MMPIEESQHPSVELSVSPLGGIVQTVIVRPSFPGNDPRNRMPVSGAPGRYRARVIFQRPSSLPTAEHNVSLSEDVEGDSHIAIAAPAVRSVDERGAPTSIRLRTGEGPQQIVIDGFPNKAGFLSHLVFEFGARDFGDAEALALRIVAPCLSAWSVILDVPVLIWRIQIGELASSAAAITFVAPFEEVGLAGLPQAGSSPEFRTVASFYREALNSRSPVYEFLCLYKVAEAITGQRKGRVEQAKAEGKPPRQPSETLPTTDAELVEWVRRLYPIRKNWLQQDVAELLPPELRGRKINDVLDKAMRPLRIDVAHGLWSDQGVGTLIMDEALHLRRVQRLLPALRLIVRRMLKTDFAEFRAAFPDST